jgi:hypothetical protein
MFKMVIQRVTLLLLQIAVEHLLPIVWQTFLVTEDYMAMLAVNRITLVYCATLIMAASKGIITVNIQYS